MLNNSEFGNDSQLWNAFIQGREGALKTIYENQIKGLYNYGYNLCRNPSLVEDSIQDLFAYLQEHNSKLGPTDNIKYYLFRSLRRILAKSTLKNNNLKTGDDLFNDSIFSVGNYETELIEDETITIRRKKIMQQIENLPKRQKEAIFLLYIYGFSYSEVANTMDLEIKSVYNLINKAIHSLRENFKNIIFLVFLLFL